MKDLECGVPQGSVLGVILYLLYPAAVGDILMRHCLSFHLYADDMQLYAIFQPSDGGRIESAIMKVQDCIWKKDQSMSFNKLMLDRAKTGGTSYRLQISSTTRSWSSQSW